MYRIYENDTVVGTTSTVTYIMYNTNNGCYNICERNVAQGFTCLMPKEVEIETEEGEIQTVTITTDWIFVLTGQKMKGDEPIGRIESIDDPIMDEPTISDYQEALAALGVTL